MTFAATAVYFLRFNASGRRDRQQAWVLIPLDDEGYLSSCNRNVRLGRLQRSVYYRRQAQPCGACQLTLVAWL